jgi:hypothetical protein
VVPNKGTRGAKNGYAGYKNGYMWCQKEVREVTKMGTCGAKKGFVG